MQIRKINVSLLRQFQFIPVQTSKSCSKTTKQQSIAKSVLKETIKTNLLKSTKPHNFTVKPPLPSNTKQISDSIANVKLYQIQNIQQLQQLHNFQHLRTLRRMPLRRFDKYFLSNIDRMKEISQECKKNPQLYTTAFPVKNLTTMDPIPFIRSSSKINANTIVNKNENSIANNNANKNNKKNIVGDINESVSGNVNRNINSSLSARSNYVENSQAVHKIKHTNRMLHRNSEQSSGRIHSHRKNSECVLRAKSAKKALTVNKITFQRVKRIPVLGLTIGQMLILKRPFVRRNNQTDASYEYVRKSVSVVENSSRYISIDREAILPWEENMQSI